MASQAQTHLPWECHATGSAWPLWHHRVCVPRIRPLRGWLRSFPGEHITMEALGYYFCLKTNKKICLLGRCYVQRMKNSRGSKQFNFSFCRQAHGYKTSLQKHSFPSRVGNTADKQFLLKYLFYVCIKIQCLFKKSMYIYGIS